MVLIGLSGSGKSTVGAMLAKRLARPFVDTDAMVETAAGRDVAQIFATDGEVAFRDLERQALARAVDGPPAVIATGGGAPVDERNRAALWNGNYVVWLDAPVETLAARLGQGGSGRPLLAGQSPALRLAALAAARGAIYRTAHAHIETSRLTAAEVVSAILGLLRAC